MCGRAPAQRAAELVYPSCVICVLNVMRFELVRVCIQVVSPPFRGFAFLGVRVRDAHENANLHVE